jgi:DNA polymerase-3 subunit gamma/tau
MTEILYRKWRPIRFDEVAGQEHVSTTLKNALATGRVAHAYLFSGSRGTGKTSTGRLLAKALNCTNRQDGEPCNQCESCKSFLAGRAMDMIELDAASNRGIDEIRSLRDKVAFAPGAGEYKIYLIDEVHMLTDAAFNALLKTLEEPPPHVVFILATTEAHKLPATIASRCQRFDFKRIPLAAAIGRLQTICDGENIAADLEALELIARQATGSLRDGTNLLDQLATSYGGELTVERVRAGLGLIADERVARLARVTLAGDLAGGLEIIAAVRDDGLDLRQFQRELIDELRDLLMVKSGLSPAEGATEERLQDLRDAVAGVPTPQILTALKSFGEADLKQDPNSTLPLDIALADCVLGQNSIKQSNDSPATQPVTTHRASSSAPSSYTVRPEPVEGREAPRTTPSRPQPGSPESTRRVEGREAPETAPSAPARPEPVAERSAPILARPEALEGRDSAPARPTAPRPSPEALAAEDLPEPPPWLDDVPPLGEPPPAPTNGAPKPAEAPEPAREPAAPTPAPRPSAPAGNSLAAAREAMRPIYEKAKSVGFQLGALLNGGCDIIQADEGVVVLGFRHEFHAIKASEPKNLDTLTRVISEVLGREVMVRCEVAEDVVAWTQREATSRGRDNPLVRAAQEMGAQVVGTGSDETRDDG